ncbi:MAG: hypothetical protein U9N82_05840 [Thermodesulfobacteriota bacterium]|nr:hypothetical protein [Thermodesulfobacteriota bacterium]
MGKKTTKPKISPDEYRKILEQVGLKSIFMDACFMKIRREKLGSNMRLDVRHKPSYQIEDGNRATVISDYEIIATKTTKKEFAVKIGGAYHVVLTSESPFSGEFMDIYSQSNLQMNTWPYFREFVQSMIQKAGLPPLTLPFLKS